jgi:tRNA G18 (ribose-2'-O)-methylase SpoU
MDVIHVEVNDPRLAAFRHLSDAELLRARGLFVAEGRLVVERVLADHRYSVEALLVNPASLSALQPALQARESLVVFRSETAGFEAITGFNIHRGCLALVHRLPEMSWRDAAGDSRLIVVLEGVTNADNVGGVFRNAAAFGAGAVLLSPTCCDPMYRKSIRTSMAAVLRVPFGRLTPWPAAIADLEAEGFVVAALSPRQPALTLDAFAGQCRGRRIALLVGTEGAGLTTAAEQASGLRVRIPISSHVDSLNLAVATGIALSRVGASMTIESAPPASEPVT